MRNRSRYSVPIRAIGHTAARGAIRAGQVEAEVIAGVLRVSDDQRPVVEVDHPPAVEAGGGGQPGRPGAGVLAAADGRELARPRRCSHVKDPFREAVRIGKGLLLTDLLTAGSLCGLHGLGEALHTYREDGAGRGRASTVSDTLTKRTRPPRTGQLYAPRPRISCRKAANPSRTRSSFGCAT